MLSISQESFFIHLEFLQGIHASMDAFLAHVSFAVISVLFGTE